MDLRISSRKVLLALLPVAMMSASSALSIAATQDQSLYQVHDRRPCNRPNADDKTRTICNLRIYQIMVESFVDGRSDLGFGVGPGPSKHRGDLQGIIDSLPYIKELGMNAIWLTPIFDPGFEDDVWDSSKRLSATGYFAKDYFSIAPEFGGLDLARQMVEKAHELGLYVFFDGVFGHHKSTGVLPSPTGKMPQGHHARVSYPGSLDFYKEVAKYWIEELEIDGWRLDVANEVPIDAWRAIRGEISELCDRREKRGKKWGTLCYMVGEVWKDEITIQNSVLGPPDAPGLSSAFDFSTRYALVKVLATQEWTNQKNASRQPASSLAQQMVRNEQVFADHVMKNFMIGNHDLVRFGDLIERARYPGPSDVSYWLRHKAAFSFMTAYSGPITVYYNEELGVEVPNYADQVLSNCNNLDLCDDHIGRTDGQIPRVAGPPLSSFQKDLLQTVKDLFKLRAEHPALYSGSRRHVYSDDSLFIDLKFHQDDHILYALNTGTTLREISLPHDMISQSQNPLVDLMSKRTLPITQGYYNLKVPALTGVFWLVDKAILGSIHAID